MVCFWVEEINRDHEFDLYSNERKTYLKVRNMQGENHATDNMYCWKK